MIIFNFKDIIAIGFLGIYISAFIILCIYCGVKTIAEKRKNRKK